MTSDGVAPDLDRHHVLSEPKRWLAESCDLAELRSHERAAAIPSIEWMSRVRIALQDARDELLRAHASTVLAMGRLGRDPARMTDALVEARSQHEALFLVLRAVEALTRPSRRAGGDVRTVAPSKIKDRHRTDVVEREERGANSWRTYSGVTSSGGT